MMETVQGKRRRAFLLSDIAGAGFLVVVYMGIILFLDRNMYAFTTNLAYWIVFWCCGTLCSLLIGQIISSRPSWKLPVYIVVFGVFFLLLQQTHTIALAGLYGAICTLLLYFGKYLAKNIKIFKASFCVIPLLFLLFLILLPDTTVKKEWNEVVGQNSYSAYFLYFNGEKEIPVEAKAGEELLVKVQVQNENGGGYSYYIVDGQNRTLSQLEEESRELKLHIKKTGTYTIVLKGNGLRGGFDVEWQQRQQET
ncbi:hypothetical protein ABER75_00920 [Niallia taxi]|uniref:hypothetical protein n=1 Tax=Niallia taxi TaxID=2499688 RepID=UPI003D2C6E78